jgi:hypothetical protein
LDRGDGLGAKANAQALVEREDGAGKEDKFVRAKGIEEIGNGRRGEEALEERIGPRHAGDALDVAGAVGRKMDGNAGGDGPGTCRKRQV